MCGIIACLNCEEQTKILLEGLNQLQNRGYDSSGICLLDNNKFNINKFASDNANTSIEKLQHNLINNQNMTHIKY